MKSLKDIFSRLRINPRILVIYVLIYNACGICMNEIGLLMEIAWFEYRFQILICYVFFMVPVSILLRKLPWHAQYAYGLVFMGLYEFGGYAFQTSIAQEHNVIDQLFQVRNFSLAMSIFFATYFPLGNLLVKNVAHWLKIKDV